MSGMNLAAFQALVRRSITNDLRVGHVESVAEFEARREQEGTRAIPGGRPKEEVLYVTLRDRSVFVLRVAHLSGPDYGPDDNDTEGEEPQEGTL
jgi:hypothetical protein